MMSEASFASLGPTLLARKGGAKPAMRPQLTPLPTSHAEIAAMAEEQLEDLGWNDMGSDTGSETGSDCANDLEIDEPEEIGTATSPEVIRANEGSPLLARKTPQAAHHPAITGYENDDAEDGEEDEDEAWDAEAWDAGAQDDDTEEFDAEEGETEETGPHRIIDPLGGAEIVPIGSRSDHTRAQQPEQDERIAATSPVILSQHKRAARRVLEDVAAQMTAPRDRAATARKSASARHANANARRAAFTLRLDPARHLKLRLAATMHGVSAQALVTDALDALLGDMEELDALVERMTRN